MRMKYLKATEDVLTGQFVVYTETTFRIARKGDDGETIGMVMYDCRKGDGAQVMTHGALPPYAWIEWRENKEVSHSAV